MIFAKSLLDEQFRRKGQSEAIGEKRVVGRTIFNVSRGQIFNGNAFRYQEQKSSLCHSLKVLEVFDSLVYSTLWLPLKETKKIPSRPSDLSLKL